MSSVLEKIINSTPMRLFSMVGSGTHLLTHSLSPHKAVSQKTPLAYSKTASLAEPPLLLGVLQFTASCVLLLVRVGVPGALGRLFNRQHCTRLRLACVLEHTDRIDIDL